MRGASPKIPDSDRDRIAALADAGWTDPRIGKLYGSGPQTVQHFRRRHEIPSRHRIALSRAAKVAPDPVPQLPRRTSESPYTEADVYEDVPLSILNREFIAERAGSWPRLNVAAIHDPQPGRQRA